MLTQVLLGSVTQETRVLLGSVTQETTGGGMLLLPLHTAALLHIAALLHTDN